MQQTVKAVKEDDVPAFYPGNTGSTAQGTMMSAADATVYYQGKPMQQQPEMTPK